MSQEFGTLIRTLCRHDETVLDRVLQTLKRHMVMETTSGMEMVNPKGVLQCLLELERCDSDGNPHPAKKRPTNVIPLNQEISIRSLKQVPIYYPETHPVEDTNGLGPWRIMMWVPGNMAQQYLNAQSAHRVKKYETGREVYIEYTGTAKAKAKPAALHAVM